MKKCLIFDSGPIISLTMSGLLYVIEKLKKDFDGEFIITPQVKQEVVDNPFNIKKYKFESIQVKDLIDRGVLKMSSEIVPDNKLGNETKKVLQMSGSILRLHETGEKIKIIQEGEASCLAFANLCKCENVIAVDERTTRLISESPENLEKLMESKLHTELDMDLKVVGAMKKYNFIRSSEILYVAFKRGLIPLKKNKDTLDALLYGVKFNGAAISSGEIEEIKKMV